eukprot:TRINITY_DN5089_c1_g5_i1.p1 TRINITY_DN5089_c1_g5~~TRINITY_DN5089_c1_g5_i1.p1  ORF type:complete len:105 (-),score=18.10 TRINITY_DN5089_c1_g5_i1:215-529(-)
MGSSGINAEYMGSSGINPEYMEAHAHAAVHEYAMTWTDASIGATAAAAGAHAVAPPARAATPHYCCLHDQPRARFAHSYSHAHQMKVPQLLRVEMRPCACTRQS